MTLRLSILDQTPIRKGGNASATLQESHELARLADQWGYTRYWISEHHNTRTLAAAAPEVLIASLANGTQRIRFGSGGIMLPNHSALKVAENFRLLEALYPGRIDLGIGRAPGGDRATSQLLNPSNTFDPQEYIEQIRELQHFLADSPSPNNALGRIRAIPHISSMPPIWALSSSGESAFVAAHFGLGLSYAQFINPHGAAAAIQAYRSRFNPSVSFPEPATSIGVFAFTSTDSEKLNRARALFDYRLISFENGKFDELVDFDDIKDHRYTAAEENRLIYHRQRYLIGTPAELEAQFAQLTSETGTEEILIATFAETKEDRMESYRLLGENIL